jgi:hypothetical protein
MSAQPRPKAQFIDFSARDFNRKFDEHRPKFAVNHDESIRNVIPLRTGNLEADGADFTAALDWLMTLAGYTEAPRSFVRAVVGSIKRDADDNFQQTARTDEELAEVMGCSIRTVQRQRKDYLEQENGSDKVKGTNFSIIAVTEGEYDREKGRHAPTRYRFLIGAQTAQTVERARTSPEWKRDQRKAIREAAIEVFEDIPEAPPAATTRKKRKASDESEAKRIRSMIVTLSKNLADLERKKLDGNLPQLCDELKTEIGVAMNAPTMREVFNVQGLAGAARQNVMQGTPANLVVTPEEEETTASQHETPPQGDVDEHSDSIAEAEYLADEPQFETSVSRETAQKETEVWCESPEMKKSTKLSFSEESFAPPDEPPHAELTYEPDIYEPDADELAERAAICAVECGIEFDEEGHITYVPPGVPDCIIDAVMRE